MRVYSYKIARDFGFAPNPYFGVCTLATCKPKIRAGAKIGDIIVGCGSAQLNLPGRVVFSMRVAGKCTFQEYWDNPRFRNKRPTHSSNQKRAYGDNIYHRTDDGGWVQEWSHHSLQNGELNKSNLDRDTGSDHVIWGDEFVYYGREAPLIPSDLRACGGDDLYPARRSYRVNFAAEMTEAVAAWFDTLPRGVRGRPASWE